MISSLEKNMVLYYQWKKIYKFHNFLTIHCGIEADKRRIISNIRAVIYLCYIHSSLCNQANLKKKQKAFNKNRTTNHYPCKIKLFSKHPRTYGGIIPEITPIESPIVNELGKKLFGF